jgi:glycine cleavage system H protein
MDPTTLKYTKTHEWAAVEGDVATIGISDFAVHLLSDLVYADLPPIGKKVTQGQPFGEVESVKAG